MTDNERCQEKTEKKVKEKSPKAARVLMATIMSDDLKQDIKSEGIDFFIEKPLCIKKQDIEIISKSLELAKAKKLIVTSCHPRRFDPPFVWLKEKMERLLR